MMKMMANKLLTPIELYVRLIDDFEAIAISI